MADTAIAEEEEEISLTPPQIRELATAATKALIPERSKVVYERHYTQLMTWCSENDLPASYMSENVLLAYFQYLKPRRKESTLWNVLSALKSTLLAHDNLTLNLDRLTAVMKHWTKRYKGKKSAVFSRENVDAFLDNAPDSEFLQIKLMLLFALYGALRRSELHAMTRDNIKRYDDHLIISLADSKTGPRSFVVLQNTVASRDPMRYYDQYLALLPENLPDNKLWWHYKKGKITRSHVGVNWIGDIPKKQVATFLQLSNKDEFTGHAFRRTSATFLADSGIDLVTLKRLGGWKSDSVAQGYIEESLPAKRKVAEMLNLGEESASVRPAKVPHLSENAPINVPPLPISIGNATNCVFNITFTK